MTKQQRNWLTTEEVAELEQVHVKTVQRWIRLGHLPATRKPGGRHWKIPQDYENRLDEAQQ